MAALFRPVHRQRISPLEPASMLASLRLQHWLPALACVVFGLVIWTSPARRATSSWPVIQSHAGLLAMTSSVPSMEFRLPQSANPQALDLQATLSWHTPAMSLEHNVWFTSLPAPAAWRE